MKRNISLMIKPSSSKCNLKCKYCFYHSIADARDIKDYGFMSKETLRQIVSKVDDYCDGGNCNIGFQGGESLLVGLDFYKELVKCTTEINNGTKFNYHIQTNGTLINDEIAKFFKENNFLVGVSLDGTKEIHNLNRIDPLNRDTFNSVMKGINILKKYDVNFNVLIVVTSALCKKIDSVYKFLKKNDFKYLQFIPCLDPLEIENGQTYSYSLNVEEYSKFLLNLFNLWYKDIMEGNYVSIRYFDNIVSLFLGQDYESCDMRGICSCQHIIESDGSMYPCDFYTYEKYSIGNILEETFDEIHHKNETINFMKESLNKNNKCSICRFKNICRGGCRRHRENSQDNMNYYCAAYYEFFSKTLDRFEIVANKLRRNM